jgi:cell division protein FtsA
MNDMSRRQPLARQIKPPPEEPARPRAIRSGPFGVLDIGSTKIACLIGRAESDGRLRALGFGWQKGRGVKSGGIVDLDEAERAIRAAVGAAEDMADTRLKSVVVNLSCGQPESRLFNVQWPVDGRAVTAEDVKRVVREARGRAMAEGRETIHSLPLSFSTDETQGVTDPRGLFCETLTAQLHVIDAGNTALRTLAACLARCELDISALVSAPMASGLAALVGDERELGATVIDMGGGTTSWPKARCCTPPNCRSAGCTSPTTSRGCSPRLSPMPNGSRHYTATCKAARTTTANCCRSRRSARTSTRSPKFRARC